MEVEKGDVLPESGVRRMCYRVIKFKCVMVVKLVLLLSLLMLLSFIIATMSL